MCKLYHNLLQKKKKYFKAVGILHSPDLINQQIITEK